YEPGRYFVEGQLAYAYNEADTSRSINFGGLNRIASGEYDANQFSATVNAGLPLKGGAFTFIPKAGLFYSYADADSYTETGAGSMNLVVKPATASVLEGSLGASASFERKMGSGVLRPEVRVAALYEFLDDDAATSSRFTGATTTFTTTGLKPAQFGSTAGLGLSYASSNGAWDVRLDYDAVLREDFISHGGMVMGRLFF
ncbi:MAG: autotransporter outer membrane beta-barrel domain-containing protein, partial [Patescibacteria group bacterium]